MADDEGAEEVDELVLWGDVLTQAKIVPSCDDAKKFTKLLASPPSLKVLRENRTNVPAVPGVHELPLA